MRAVLARHAHGTAFLYSKNRARNAGTFLVSQGFSTARERHGTLSAFQESGAARHSPLDIPPLARKTDYRNLVSASGGRLQAPGSSKPKRQTDGDGGGDDRPRPRPLLRLLLMPPRRLPFPLHLLASLLLLLFLFPLPHSPPLPPPPPARAAGGHAGDARGGSK